MRDARLLYFKMLHRAGEGFLILVAAGLEVVDELEVDPSGDPVPVEVVDDDVLLEYALIVAAPCDERHVLAAAELVQLRQRVGKRDPVGKALLIEAGYLLDLVVHTLEVYGLYVDGQLFLRAHILVELHRAYLDYLPAQMYGELVEHGGFGTHRLIPFQIHHYIIHTLSFPLLYCHDFFIIAHIFPVCTTFFTNRA